MQPVRDVRRSAQKALHLLTVSPKMPRRRTLSLRLDILHVSQEAQSQVKFDRYCFRHPEENSPAGFCPSRRCWHRRRYFIAAKRLFPPYKGAGPDGPAPFLMRSGRFRNVPFFIRSGPAERCFSRPSAHRRSPFPPERSGSAGSIPAFEVGVNHIDAKFVLMDNGCLAVGIIPQGHG